MSSWCGGTANGRRPQCGAWLIGDPFIDPRQSRGLRAACHARLPSPSWSVGAST
jgi:hypothetical protein